MESRYLDSAGNGLDDYPRPSVAVDTAVLTISGEGEGEREGEGEGELSVLLTLGGDALRGGPPEWRLPGTFLHPGETLVMAVLRSLRTKAGVEGLAPRQLHVFDEPTRDDRGWVLSVAHFDVVRIDRLAAAAHTRVVPVAALPPLTYDHAAIIAFAVEALRADYRRIPDPAGLIDETFTMRELRAVHEAVAGEGLLPDTFRRTMLPQLTPTGEHERARRGRPAELYRKAVEVAGSTRAR